MQNDGQLLRDGDRVDAPLPAPRSSSSRRLSSGSGAPSPPRRACCTHHPIACPGNGAGDVLFTRLMFRRREPEIRPTIFDERKRPGLSTADLKVSAVSTPTPGAVMSRRQVASSGLARTVILGTAARPGQWAWPAHYGICRGSPRKARGRGPHDPGRPSAPRRGSCAAA